jgi:hypothetical protein
MVDSNDRNKTARKSLLITDIPPDIRQALVDDARQQDVSVNETAVRILCGCFNVKHVESLNGLRGQTGTPGFVAADPKNTTLLIRGGAKLHRQMDKERRKRDATLRGVTLECLALHYDVAVPDVGRRPRQTKGTR